jgi:hypothetical protein
VSKIFFWKSGDDDACSFYRCIEPARVLRGLGHDVTVNRFAGLGELMTSDVVVIQRPTEAAPLHVMDKLISLPFGRRPRIVVELDDDFWSIPDHNPAKASPAQLARVAKAVTLADAVTVTNQHLADQVYERTGFTQSQIRVVPNYVPARFVVDKVPAVDAFGTPTITWAGSDTHRRDFGEVAVPLRKLLRERTDFRVRIVGAPYADRLWNAAPRARADVSQVPWIEGVARYIPTLSGHIGLAPLADDLFNRSKSDLRLKELAARGMAVMASDVGPYGESPVPRAHISADSWGWRIAELLDDPAGRAMISGDALDWARANTLEVHAVEWEKALLD